MFTKSNNLFDIFLLILGSISTSFAYMEYIYLDTCNIQGFLITGLKLCIKENYTLGMIDAKLNHIIEHLVNLEHPPYWLRDEDIIYLCNLDQKQFVNEFILNWNLPITHPLYDTIHTLKEAAYYRNLTWTSWFILFLFKALGFK